jgi:hypothetical protein
LIKWGANSFQYTQLHALIWEQVSFSSAYIITVSLMEGCAVHQNFFLYWSFIYNPHILVHTMYKHVCILDEWVHLLYIFFTMLGDKLISIHVTSTLAGRAKSEGNWKIMFKTHIYEPSCAQAISTSYVVLGVISWFGQ